MRLSYLCLVAVLAVLVCFGRIVTHDFVLYDDDLHIQNHRYYRPVTPANLLRFWTKPYGGLYIPLTYTVWGAIAGLTSTPETYDPRSSLEAAFPEDLSGPGRSAVRLRPEGFHVASLVAHLLSVLLVFALLRTLTGGNGAALAGALLFGLHPLQAEPVAWASGFRDVFSGLLLLGAVWQYVSYAAEPSGITRPRGRYGAATILFVLAILAKPGAVVAPLVAGVLACTLLRRPVRRTVAELAPWLALALPVLVVTKLSQPDVKIGFVAPWWQRPLVAGDAVTFYLRKLLWPFPLAIDYGRTPEKVLSSGWVYATAAAAFVVVAGAPVLFRRRWLLAAVGVFLAALLPVLGLVPFQFQSISTVADRYAYIALLGPALAVAYLARNRRTRVAVPVCVVAFTLCAAATAHQLAYWRDTPSLLGHALAVNPNSILGHVNLGVYAQRQRRFDDAIVHYQQALEQKPIQTRANYNLGMILQDRGDRTGAAKHYIAALDGNPTYAPAHYALGVILYGWNKLDEAFLHFSAALRFTDRWHHYIYTRLGAIRERQGRFAEAERFYTEALRVRPDHPRALWRMGALRERSGRIDDAIRFYSQALRAQPGHRQARNALRRLRAGKRPPS